MINLENIARFDKLYNFLLPYIKFTHNKLYYKKIYVIGRENIPPKDSPSFFITNHQNGLMDPLAILCLFKDNRQPIFIARGDIFKHDTIAKILRFLKILPTFRRRDGSFNDIRSNNHIFKIASKALQQGATLVMYPEAQHQAGHFMATFKKGFPRVAFAAEEYADYRLGLQIVPASLHYKNYFHFRGELVITVGKPFPLQPYLELYKTESNNAYLQLNEECIKRVKAMTLNVEDQEYYAEIDLLRNRWHTVRLLAQKQNPRCLPTQLQEDLQIVSELTQLQITEPERYAQLMADTRAYRTGLVKLKLHDWIINYPPVLSKLLLQSLIMVLLFPLALAGFIYNGLPFHFSGIFRKMVKDKMLHSSFNYAASAIIAFPIWYVALFVTSWILSEHLWVALLQITVAFGLLFFFYAYRVRRLKIWASWRYCILKRQKNALLLKVLELSKRLWP
ncbi:MAG: 1-acyl-sn-glycerol-3-phosphate acyltransferase [Bacteroidales bacterium]|jgi:1-acyl-sn-glycerol-3-phosphate acyltransferase|nr:1-acyl-sn-glycerol-3-phosphate acyltransferase [Bacteroidales bacterium]